MEDETVECYRCGRDTDNLQGLCDDCKFDEQINEELEDSGESTEHDLSETVEGGSETPKAEYSTWAKIAGGKFNVMNKTLRRFQITNTKDEAKRLARRWDAELKLSPKGNKANTLRKRVRLVDEEGNELPTKTELIQEGVRKGWNWKEIAEYARCRYQMAYNIGSRYAKAFPNMVGSEKETQ